MATQSGLIPFTGTIQNLTGYKVGNKHFLRRKPTISKKRFQTDPSFANPRRNASWFGAAILECKAVYYQLPIPLRNQKEIWYPMLKEGIKLVRKDTPSSEIFEMLTRKYVQPVLEKEAIKEEVKDQPVKAVSIRQPIKQIIQPALPEQIQLGRACGPVDSNLLIGQLSASNTLIRKLLDGVETRIPILREQAHKLAQRE